MDGITIYSEQKDFQLLNDVQNQGIRECNELKLCFRIHKHQRKMQDSMVVQWMTHQALNWNNEV